MGLDVFGARAETRGKQMKIAIISKPLDFKTGVGRYVEELSDGIKGLGHEVILVHPFIPFPKWLIRLAKRLLRWDLENFLYNYPLMAHYPEADIYHISSQNLATLMIFHRPPGKVVITVHDLIPALSEGNKEIYAARHIFDQLFDAIAMQGLRRADCLVAVSKFTKTTLVNY
jgi:hypothetical protein